MPKEITYTSDPTYLRTLDGDEHPEGSEEAERRRDWAGATWRRRGVHVGWVKDREVEVGVAAFDVSREMPEEGVYLTLDREGCNRVIRALRKARDAAYGADA